MAPMYISSPRWCTSPLTSFDQWCVVSVLGAAQVHLSWPCELGADQVRVQGLADGVRDAVLLVVLVAVVEVCNHAALVPAVHVVSVLCLVSVPRQRCWTFQLVTSFAMHSAHCAQDRGVPQVQFLVWCCAPVVVQQVPWPTLLAYARFDSGYSLLGCVMEEFHIFYVKAVLRS